TFPRIDVYATILAMKEKGIVPENSGAPFHTTTHNMYTNSSSNPKKCQNMEDGDYCIITWVVNATGDINNTWEFYVIAESTLGNQTIKTNSQKINITITSENKAPVLNVISPTNNQIVGADNLTINVSATCETSLISSVSYVLKNSSGVIRSGSLTKQGISDYWVGLLNPLGLKSGTYTLNITAENSLGKKSYSIKTLVVDSTYPNITIHTTYPQNTNTPWLNLTVTDDVNVSGVWYILNSGNDVFLFSGSKQSVSNNTKISLDYPGINTFIIFANDTSNNTARKQKMFYEIFNFNLTNWTKYHINRLSDVNSISTIPSGDSVSNNQLFNITINTTHFNITLYNVNGTVTFWGFDFNLRENDSSLYNATRDYGSDVYLSVYLDEWFIPDYLIDETYNGTTTKEYTNLSVDDYAIITFSPNSSKFTQMFDCGRGLPASLESCSVIPKCTNGYNGTSCYEDLTNSTKVYIPRFSTLVVTNDTTPPRITINSPTGTYTDGDVIYSLMANISASPDTKECNYSLDSSAFNKMFRLVNSSVFTSIIGPIKNGNHNIEFKCMDVNGNTNSTTHQFTISDNTAPSISNIVERRISTSSATIEWYTNEPADSTVYYGKSCNDLDDSTSNSTYVKEHSIKLTGLSDDTTYYYKIKSCDYQGICKTTTCDSTTKFKTDELEITNEPGESAGGQEQSLNITKTTIFWQELLPGQEISFKVNSNSIAVEEILFEVSNTTQGCQMSVESYSDVPPGLPQAPDNVYQYLDITANFKENIKSLRIKFKIPQSWFTTNHLDPDKVTLYHYKNNNWVEEYTISTGVSDGYYNYYAKVDSLSKFAISTVKAPQTLETCGNGICNKTAGENCSNCEIDCGKCLTTSSSNISNNQTITEINKPAENNYIPILIVLIAASPLAIYMILKKKTKKRRRAS
ncbi:MAG: PGF-pre-PGF domain-containing protein, partial [Nanoarchaeota archaeon]|nr:PGF-pre-PGF domain-containing protein [Nanoarchaeota archaeon]